jgi:hypothetical protein
MTEVHGNYYETPKQILQIITQKVFTADSLFDVSNDCNCFSPEFEYFPRKFQLKAS